MSPKKIPRRGVMVGPGQVGSYRQRAACPGRVSQRTGREHGKSHYNLGDGTAQIVRRFVRQRSCCLADAAPSIHQL